MSGVEHRWLFISSPIASGACCLVSLISWYQWVFWSYLLTIHAFAIQIQFFRMNLAFSTHFKLVHRELSSEDIAVHRKQGLRDHGGLYCCNSRMPEPFLHLFSSSFDGMTNWLPLHWGSHCLMAVRWGYIPSISTAWVLLRQLFVIASSIRVILDGTRFFFFFHRDISFTLQEQSSFLLKIIWS